MPTSTVNLRHSLVHRITLEIVLEIAQHLNHISRLKLSATCHWMRASLASKVSLLSNIQISQARRHMWRIWGYDDFFSALREEERMMRRELDKW
jgi:hypothetical protein